MTTTAPPPAMSRRRVLEALSGLLVGMFVSMLSATVVSTSLPVIVHDLGGDQNVFTWVVTATLLTTAISTPIWGKLADLFNRKLLIQLALVLFVVATAAAGLAQDPGTMIAFRAVQGVGVGGLAALSQIIMADIISPRERGRYMGLFGAVMALATVGGPLLGGVITDTLGWRWNFYVAIPFAIAALVLLQKTLRRSTPRRRARVDYLGIVLLSIAVALLLVWVTSAGSSFEWWSLETILMVGGALVSTALFIFVELRSREPLLPLALFRNRTFTLSVLASISAGLAMFGASVFLSQYMQMARGATPTEAGIMTLPMIAGLVVALIVVGQLISRFGRWKSYLVAGAVLLLAGMGMLTTLEYDTNFALVSLYMFLTGAGVGMTMQNLVLIVQNTARPENLGAASAGVTFFRSLGGTVGVSIMGAALAGRASDLFDANREAIGQVLVSLGAQGARIAEQLQSGALPDVRALPEPVQAIVEDIYAQAISYSFLVVVPIAVLSLLAIVFLPNTPLTRMTTSERMAASEADLATVTTSTGMATLPATGALAAQAPRTAVTQSIGRDTAPEAPGSRDGRPR